MVVEQVSVQVPEQGQGPELEQVPEQVLEPEQGLVQVPGRGLVQEQDLQQFSQTAR
jgi:hypothetical protein